MYLAFVIIYQFCLIIIQFNSFLKKMVRTTDMKKLAGFNIPEQITQSIINVSQNGHYQKKLFLLFFLVSMFIAMQTYGTSLFYMNPVFSCGGINQKIQQDVACEMINQCKIVNTQTITSELQLYCDSRKADRTLLQTTVGFGNWLGLGLVWVFSDRFGRRLCFCIGILLLNLTWIFQLVGVHLKSITLLVASEFISGVSNKLIYLNFLVLLTRFMDRQSYRNGTLGWFIACHGLSQIIIACTNELFSSWRVIVYIYAVGIFACSIASLTILKQDPTFLFDKGETAKAKSVIESVGQENGYDFQTIQTNLKRIDECYEVKLLRVENNMNLFDGFNLMEIVRSDVLFKVLIISAAGATYLMVSKSIELSIQGLQYSYNFNLLIIGVSNLCGFCTAIYVIKIQQQQKRGLIYTSLLYGIIAMLFLFPFCTENGVIQTIVIFLLRFFLCWSVNFYTRLKVDSFPEKYQGTLIGTVQFLINFGTLLSPLLIQKSVDNHISPIVFMNIIRLVIGTLPVLFLVEGRIVLANSKDQMKALEQ